MSYVEEQYRTSEWDAPQADGLGRYMSLGGNPLNEIVEILQETSRFRRFESEIGFHVACGDGERIVIHLRCSVTGPSFLLRPTIAKVLRKEEVTT
jgi:hypothetical protein